ncbi:BadF/BadG/BcrA/BcrD ATPase family protein [Streptomyces albogriseolus]|uniref:N-acetylglucosamine kinase n=1 Tax=Streptomyces TaxID=1883 RepID=UPI00143073C3|nr:BadF/BadG/BcrA/BcrD ATPase family protein [Streptomyces sp. 2BBP-J2]NIL51727.1 ATPase [Streptomyces sp. 2BBP-J2]
MGLTAAVLAVDAGNSKTDVAVVAPDGTVLSTAQGGGFRPPADGLDEAMATLAAPVTEALRTAGVPQAAHLSACLANADLPVEEEQLTEAIASRRWSSTVTVRNDTFAVLRAGVSEPRGVAVVCGAGINCVGMRPDGRTARFPALGRFSGDWGGGWALAEEALWHAARAADGRGGPTALATALPAHYGVPDMPALIEALHLRRIPPRRRHEATPVLFATAAQGDRTARGVIDRQAAEIVTMATVALTRLDLLDEDTPVLLGGSVLAADHPLLTEGIRTRLTARAPKAVPHVVTARPVLGAALLGLDDVSAPPEAHERLRAHYT